MHPVVRLLTLLVFAAVLPWLPPVAVLVAAGLLLSGTAWHPAMRSGALQGLLRLRWLLLSILVLYLWFVPGDPLVPALGEWSPTGAGVLLAMHRGGILLVMVWAAAAMLAVTPAREVTAALRGIMVGPLRSRTTLRFADRVGLLLAELPLVRDRVFQSVRNGDGRFAERAARLVEAVEIQASENIAPEAPLPLGPVPATQWLLPAAVLLAGAAVIIFL